MSEGRQDVYGRERSHGTGEAVSRLEAFLIGHGLRAQIDYSDDFWQVTRLTLMDARNQRIASGAGKGTHHRVGALAEAIEHFVFSRSGWGDAPEMPLKEIVAQPGFGEDFFLVDLAGRHPDSLIATEAFEAPGGRNIAVPLAYVDPQMFNERGSDVDAVTAQLARYSSNNGGAIGLDWTEGALHGLNEAVERGHESLLFQHIMGIETQVPWAECLAPEDERGQAKLARIREDYGEVRLVIAPTRADNYVAFALGPVVEGTALASIGAGCSVFAEGALQRAIDELAQTIVLAIEIGLGDDAWRMDDETAAAHLRRTTQTARLIDWQSAHLRDLPTVNTPQALPRPPDGMTVAQQLTRVTDALGKRAIVYCHRAHYRDANIQLVKSFVPAFDKFFTIRRGNFVIPNWAYRVGTGLTGPC